MVCASIYRLAFPCGGRGTAIAVDEVFLRVSEDVDPYRCVCEHTSFSLLQWEKGDRDSGG